MNIGIIGAGHIAEKMATTLGRMEDCSCLAIASRSLEKAQDFAARFGVARAYGSYDDLLADPDVDLVYVATPHSCHFDITRRAILAGKPCLVEKSFMANATEAATIIALAREKGVFVAEAMWPRYMPVLGIARDVLASTMQAIEDAGFQIVMHVHDEIIAEADLSRTAEELSTLMSTAPAWAKGLPLDAKGFTCKRYRKE